MNHDNPFADDIYAQEGQSGSREEPGYRPEEPNMIQELLKDDTFPEEVRQEWGWVFARDHTLGFLDPERKESMLLNFDILKIDTLNSKPYYNYGFDDELKWNKMRVVFESKLNRALGVRNAQGMKNERIIQQTQFAEQRSISDEGGSGSKDGFLKRLLGRSGS